jgi:hypothetical protein
MTEEMGKSDPPLTEIRIDATSTDEAIRFARNYPGAVVLADEAAFRKIFGLPPKKVRWWRKWLKQKGKAN